MLNDAKPLSRHDAKRKLGKAILHCFAQQPFFMGYLNEITVDLFYY